MMNNGDVIPASYKEWRHCIEVRGRIRLTPSYIRQRLSEIQDDEHVKTKEFVRLYGREHLQRIIAWFRRAAEEMSGGGSDI
ncbi:MAG TPA: hypothetical protein DCY79_23230 [Planctomycetaceae bacterium]|nr:hypothetical protein [Blastopirellula sp.]HAY82732.1 hypothetical protein [Planctomycetaceae bacterium]|tara:strand:- start:326 stop:568 length:243 start_codon:yes stop_codon:yes gene_type:complete